MKVLNVILSHQLAPAVNRVVSWWYDYVAPESLLIVHTGSEHEFAEISHFQKLHLSDPRVNTRDHQRELQSYTGLFAAVSKWCAPNEYNYIYFAEYDHLPLVKDLNQRQLDLLEKEGADVLAFHLRRVDDTNYVHFLYHSRDPAFQRHWRELSVRPDPNVVLSIFGSGSFWRREAFDDVAGRAEPFPIYLEIHLATLAHHLGYRLRDYGEQSRFVHNLGDRADEIDRARKDEAWTLHPVKKIPGSQ